MVPHAVGHWAAYVEPPYIEKSLVAQHEYILMFPVLRCANTGDDPWELQKIHDEFPDRC